MTGPWDINGAAIVHRRFSSGDGWAYSPEIEAVKREVISSLDHYLKERHSCRFEVDLPNGQCLVGSVTGHGDGKNVDGGDQEPAVLRAAVFGSRPADKQLPMLFERLAELSPAAPGPDAGLSLGMSEGARQKPSRALLWSSDRKRQVVRMAREKGVLIGATVVALILGSAVAFRPSSNADAKTVAKMMRSQLHAWGVESSTTSDATVNEYLGFLSQAAISGTVETSAHPYVAFIKRLPPKPEQPLPSMIWTQQRLRTTLARLAATLEDQHTPAGDPTALESLARIEAQMNYDAWRKTTRSEGETLARFATPPSEAVLRYVEHFRSSTSADLEPFAQRMRRYSIRWGMPEQTASPFEVVRFFLTTLTRPEWLDKCSPTDKRHAYWAFVDRLPGQANCVAWTCDNRQQLERHLKALLARLGGPTDAENSESLVDAIAQRMDYEKWVKETDGPFTKQRKPQSPELNLFVQLFSGNTF